MTPIDTVWLIPHIQDAIASHLDRPNYLQCIKVSHLFHQCFIPFLWEVVVPSSSWVTTRFLLSPAQARNRHYVKQLSLNENESLRWMNHFESHGPFPNLVSFTYESLSHNAWTLHAPTFVAIAGNHSTLTTLELRAQQMSVEFLQAFKVSMTRLSQLQNLRLRFDALVTYENLAQILQSTVQVQRLGISCDEEFNSEPFLAADTRFEPTKIKRMYLWLSGVPADPCLNRFLASCPDLDRLEWPTTTQSNDVSEHLAEILELHCPRLTELHLAEDGHDPNDLRAILARCSRLAVLSLNLPVENQLVIRSIISQHGANLRVLDTVGGNSIALEDLFLLASSCPSLHTLKITTRWNCAPGGTPGVLHGIKVRPWVCTALTYFHILFEDNYDAPSEIDTGRMELLFHQVGQLRLLRRWFLNSTVGTVAFSDTLMNGLPQLAGLQRLRRFNFTDCDANPLSEEQVKRIVDHWQELAYFGGLESYSAINAVRLIVGPRRKVIEFV